MKREGDYGRRDVRLAIGIDPNAPTTRDEWDDEWIALPTNQTLSRKWVRDEEVTACNRCGATFYRLWRKRHHCRNCGQIFCADCCNKFRIMDNTMVDPSSFPEEKKFNFWQPQRVCCGCVKVLDKLTRQYRWWKIFLFLDMRDIRNLMSVSKMFYFVGKAYIRSLRAIQYLPIDKKLSVDQKSLLLSNRHFLGGHSKWTTSLLKIEPCVEYLKINRSTKCSMLGCALGCEAVLTIDTLVCSLVSLNLHTKAAKYCCNEIKARITNIEARALVPLLMTRSYLQSVSNLLLLLSERDEVFLFSIYWESLMSDKSMKTKIEQHYSGIEAKVQLLSNIRGTFIEMSFLGKISKESVAKALSRTPLIFVDGDFVWTGVNAKYNAIEVKRSKSKPAILPLINESDTLKKFLYKADNLKKDYIVTHVIDLMIYYIKRELQLEFDFVSYKVYPLKNDYGIIEVIDDSRTIYDIRNDLDMSILNYILEHNPHETVESVRSKFINSLAVYSVMTYLLGIGDRHLDNIMIHRSGYLFHIDFEYILGDDPKIVSNTMRITSDMLETIGGKNSQNYLAFKTKCSAIFNCLRKHIDVFIAQLSLLATERFPKSKIIDELTKRFEPGERYLNADTYITTIIDNSHDTFTNGLLDTFYRLAKNFR